MVNGFDGVPGRKYEDFESLEAAIREWVQQVPGFERFDSEMLGTGRFISCKDWLTVDGEKTCQASARYRARAWGSS
ncbi:hypothetical protein GCM10011612_02880 [Actinomyces gaoshouyii]|uniref:Uncharacterized protein n=1 Tax=Actinomyces gaoshouyii TaxID=1960083 RepID=A0A8H9H890_9ACTO|nr:hypothetical protein GCM10011612_02880 [Actinomyces gaoshouyii]